MNFDLTDNLSLNKSNRVQSWLDDIYGNCGINQIKSKSKNKESMRMHLEKKRKLRIIRLNKHVKTKRYSLRQNASRRRRFLIRSNSEQLKSNLGEKEKERENKFNLDFDIYSYFSPSEVSDDSNIFSDFSHFNYNEQLGENKKHKSKLHKKNKTNSKDQNKAPKSGRTKLNSCSKSIEIKADDLEFDSLSSLTSNYADSFSSKNKHSFGILECWDDKEDLVFEVKCYAFQPKQIKIRIIKDVLIVTGKQKIKEDNGFYKREFRKKFYLPPDCDKKAITYNLSSNDILTIKVPRIHSVP